MKRKAPMENLLNGPCPLQPPAAHSRVNVPTHTANSPYKPYQYGRSQAGHWANSKMAIRTGMGVYSFVHISFYRPQRGVYIHQEGLYGNIKKPSRGSLSQVNIPGDSYYVVFCVFLLNPYPTSHTKDCVLPVDAMKM